MRFTQIWRAMLEKRFPRRKPDRHLLRFDQLEDRLAPAVLIVDSTADSTVAGSYLTLREAVLLVDYDGNAMAALGRNLTSGEAAQISGTFGDADTINFSSDISGQTISLGGTALTISASVTINGPGASSLAISGNDESSVLIVDSETEVTIIGLSIEYGVTGDYGEGGGIYNGGTLTVTNSTISDNVAGTPSGLSEGDGGGIYNAGMLTLNNSTVSDNTAGSAGGPDYGGGIYSSGNLSVNSTNVSDNISGEFGGGIYIASSGNDDADNVSSSTFSGNEGFESGGGIYNGGNLTVTNSSFLGNKASESSGGAIVTDNTFLLVDSTLKNNDAKEYGGAIVGGGTVECCAIIDNDSYEGGGIYNRLGDMMVFNSTIADNEASFGAGFANLGGDLALTNDTLFGNSASGQKSSDDGGGIATIAGGSTSLNNTIVAGNPTGGDLYLDSGNGSTYTGSNDIIDDGSYLSSFTRSSEANPMLTPLGNYGGPTQSMDLLIGSPAIGAGNPELAVDENGNLLTTDQRGLPRNVDNEVDIGACQTQGYTFSMISGDNQSTPVGTAFADPLAVSVVPNYSLDPVNGGIVTFTVSGSGASAIIPTSTVTIAADSASVIATANSTIGSYTVTASLGDNSLNFSLTNTALTDPPAAISVASGNDQSNTLNTVFANPLVVTVTDAAGNPLPGYWITFTGPTSGAGVDFYEGDTAYTNEQGQASLNLSANNAVGSYTLTATLTGWNMAVNFSLTNVNYSGPIANTLIVDSAADSTSASSGLTLRQAVLLLNDDDNALAAFGRPLTASEASQIGAFSGGSQMIQFDSSLEGQTMILGGSPIEISANMTIAGPGPAELAVSGNNESELFTIDASAQVAIAGLTMEDGNSGTDSMTVSYGGAIDNQGALTLSNCTLTDNVCTNAFGEETEGGAILNTGALTATDCLFTDNTSSLSFDTQGYGGAIYNAGVSTINDSTFTDNTAGNYGGAIAGTGTVTINGSSFSNNYCGDAEETGVAGYGGGAIFFDGNLTISDTNFSGNDCDAFTYTGTYEDGFTGGIGGGGICCTGGTMSLNSSSFENNTIGYTYLRYGGDDGGVLAENTTITATDCTFDDNAGNGFVGSGPAVTVTGCTATDNSGGGIGASGGTVTITDCMATINSGGGIGASATGTLTLSNCTCSDNGGDGISCAGTSGTGTVTNCEITDNNDTTVNNYLFGGGSDGCGFISSGTITLSNCTILDNSAVFAEGGAGYGNVTLSGSAYGGGIYNTGTLTVIDCTVTGNSASFYGGNIGIIYSESGGEGGGIYNDGTLTVMDSTISANTASFTGGAAGASSVSEAGGEGGGIYSAAGTVTVVDSTISANTAYFNGGLVGWTVGGYAVSDTGGEGGGIYGDSALTVSNSTLLDNTASFNGGTVVSMSSTSDSGNAYDDTGGKGGGIYGDDGLTVSNSTLLDNTASFNGGILGGNAISDNGGEGGGIFAGYGKVVNSTLWDNTASFNGGTVAVNADQDSGGDGGGISDAGAVIECTVSGNSATFSAGSVAGTVDTLNVGEGGGIYQAGLQNTIVAGNSAAVGTDVGGVSGLYNLIGDGQSEITDDNGNLVGTDSDPINPLLAPLGDYGGPTETMPLLPGSPAIGAGDPTLAIDASGNPLTTDQRSLPRFLNGTVDIGACECQGYTITDLSGGGQSTTVGTAYTEPLIAQLTPGYSGDPIQGGQLTIEAPATGASVAPTSTTFTLSASGEVSQAVAANTIAGSFQVLATTAGALAPANFSLTNNPSAPVGLVFGVQPSNTGAGDLLNPAVTVEVVDQYANIITSDDSTQVMVSVASGPGSFSGDSTTTVTVSGGLATFKNLHLNTIGSYTLAISDSSDLPCPNSDSFSVSQPIPTSLGFMVQPSDAAAGSTISPSVLIEVLDQFGQIYAEDNTGQVTLSVASGPGNFMAGSTTTEAVSDGIATFNNLIFDTAGNYTLAATSSGGLIGDNSSAFSVTPLSANHLAFTVQPSDATAGAAISLAVQVELFDIYGNLVTWDDSDVVTLSIAGGPGGFANGSTTSETVTGGIATFNNLVLDTVGTYTLADTDNVGVTGPNSNSFTVSPAEAGRLVFSVEPSDTTAGSIIEPAVQVQVLDPYGNLLADDDTDQVTLAVASGPGNFTESSTTTVTVSGGIAKFNNLLLDVPGTYELQDSTTGGITGLDSDAFVVDAVTTNPSNTKVMAGQTTTFTAAALNPLGTDTVQWQVNTGMGFTNIPSATSTTLTINNATAADNNDQYRAVFSNTAYTGTLVTSAATLAVDDVTKNPMNAAIIAGQTATFTAATSNPLGTDTVQWQVNTGDGFTNIPGATSTTLTLTNVAAADNGNLYQAVFSNSAVSGTLTTSTATLTVDAVTTNPSNATVMAGQSASFTAAALDPLGDDTVQWQVDTGGGFTDIPGATSTNLTISDATVADNGFEYRVVFSNTAYNGTLTTTPATLAVDFITANPVSSSTADLGTLTLAIGSSPVGNLVEDGSGNLFGVTSAGGASGDGTIFEWVKNTDTVIALASFSGSNGAHPAAGLIVDGSGNLFGTTEQGGASGDGAVFEWVESTGELVTLASFSSTDGDAPAGSLIEDGSGDLFGTTEFGGTYGVGTVFEWNKASGAISVLAGFNVSDGEFPRSGLVEDSSGDLFGTASAGGLNDDGDVFVWNKANGTLSDLASFSGANGSTPMAGLVEDGSGNLFGATSAGGLDNDGAVFEWNKASGTLSDLASFSGADGATPLAGLVEDGSGNLFGVTEYGGTSGEGAVFEWVESTGAITDLTSFTGADGSLPKASLVEDGNGNLFSVTSAGGGSNLGTVFICTDGLSLNAGQSTTLTATTSNPLGTDAVQWQVNSNDGNGFTNIPGADATSLSISDVAPSLNGSEYRALFSNAAFSGTLTSNTTTLSVDSVTMNPTSILINAGQTATFAAATSDPQGLDSVQWQVNTGSGFTNIPGAIGDTLLLANVAAAQSGVEYRAVFGNPVAGDTLTSNVATLSVDSVVMNPANSTVMSGQTATFTAASSNPLGTDLVQWQVNTGAGFTDIPGATDTTLTLNNLSAAESGNEYQAVFNHASTSGTLTTSTATLLVDSVTMNPTSVVVMAGEAATFTAASSNPLGSDIVQWQVNSGSGFTDIPGAASTTLTLDNAGAGESGDQYQAVFTNPAYAGTLTSSPATLLVDSITMCPSNATILAGQSVTVTAGSSNPLDTDSVQWQVDSGAGFTDIPNATGATLTLNAVTPADNGFEYQAVFTNAAYPGELVTSPAILTVDSAPTVATDPTSVLVVAGATATFTSSAVGNPAPTVQWQVSIDGGADFSNISNTGGYSGADTDMLTLTGAAATMTGDEYRALFSNMLPGDSSPSTNISSPATLTVADPAASTLSLSADSVQAGNDITVTLQLKDANGNNIPSNGIPVSFALGSGSTAQGMFGSVTNNGDGGYSATFMGTIAGNGIVSALIDGGPAASSQTVQVAPGVFSLSRSLATVSLPKVQLGGKTVVTLHAEDAYGNSETTGGLAVKFALGNPSDAIGTLTSLTDNGNGTYTAIFTGTADGGNTFTGTIAGSPVTSPAPTIAVSGAAFSPSKSTMKLSTSTVISGDTTTITLQAEDAKGNKETGGGLNAAFKLGSSKGGQGMLSSVTDNDNGTYTATFTGTIAGGNSITATIDGTKVTSLSPSIKVTPGLVNLATSTISDSSAKVKAGARITVKLQAKDSAGNKETTGGLNVLFSLANGSGTGTFSKVTDHKNGTYTATFTGTLVGTNTITATSNGMPLSSTAPAISVTPGAASVAKSLVSVSSASVVAGDSITVTLQATDLDGNKETSGGLAVTFKLGSAKGAEGTFSKVTDHKNGTYSATFTGTIAGSNTIIATIGGVKVTTTAPSITVMPGAVSLARSVILLSEASVKLGSTITVTLQAEDVYGNKETVGGLIVSFAMTNTRKDAQGTFSTVTDNGNGAYTATFTATAVGSNTIEAEISGQKVNSPAPSIKVIAT